MSTTVKECAVYAVAGRHWQEAVDIFSKVYVGRGGTLHKAWEDGEHFGMEKMIDDERLSVGVKNGIVVLIWNDKYSEDGTLLSFAMAEWG
jgi:hypothetical protein